MKIMRLLFFFVFSVSLYAQDALPEPGHIPRGTLRSTGTMNTIVVLIRFSNDTEFPSARSVYENMFNGLSAASLKSYYREVSYNKLDITSYIYPESGPSTNLSYRFPKPRGYFEPYSGSNTIGYSSTREGRLREQEILDSAVNAVKPQILPSLDIDFDDDGFVDNVMFIFKGSSGAWGDVGLWPHSGVLDTRENRINGSRVYHYSIHLEASTSVSTFCHETFHVLGAPDLYRYFTSGTPVGSWDLMASGGVHMGAYMKHKYTGKKWIMNIPVIEKSGSYSLRPLVSDSNNCFRVNSPYTDNEFFILEYRRKSGMFEGSVPGSGLLVYRINTLAGEGNGGGPPDEIYIYRKGGTPTAGGSISQAYFSQTAGRTAINDYTTDPKSFLANGSPAGLDIRNIGVAGDVITFDVVIVNCKIISPANNAAFIIGAPVEIRASAQDSAAITQVQFFVNNSPAASLTAPPYIFQWNTAGMQPGKYSIKAKAQSGSGVYKENEIALYLSNGKPVVRVIAPADSLSLGNSDSLNVSADVTGIASAVTSVKYYFDNNLLASFSQPPYQYAGQIQGAAPGAHTLRITALDAAGNTESKDLTVFVVNYILREGFETAWPPAGWNVNSLVYGWYQSGKGAFAGTKCAATRNYHAAGEATLETPPFTADSTTVLRFQWLDRSLDITRLVGGHDTTYCEVSVNGGPYSIIKYLSAADVEPAYHPEIIPLGQYAGNMLRVRWRDVSDESLEAQGTALDDVHITSTKAAGNIVTRTVSYASGWNIVSAPVLSASMLRQTLFPSANSPLYAYSSGYIQRDTIVNGSGYWLRFPSAGQIFFSGSAVQNRQIPLAQGWNIIGPFENGVSATSLTTLPAGIITSPIYGYSGNYAFANTLEPGRGYWVRSSQNGKLIVPSEIGKTASGEADRTANCGHITFTAADGQTHTLYFSGEKSAVENFELPPLPPAGIPDVRFASNMFIEKLSPSGNDIVLSSVAFPVSVSATADIRLSDALNGEIVNRLIRKGESFVLAAPGIEHLRVASAEAPREFSLAQNYPNPFNPSTAIAYSIPAKSAVRLSVYDALGRELAVPVETEQDAGSYTVVFNAAGFASGVYFYRLQAGGISSVKKLVVIK